jgi:hypothetical protein
MKELTQLTLEQEMTRITREEHRIPTTLYIELALASTANQITRSVYISEGGQAKLMSNIYPGLETKIWPQSGWALDKIL